MRSRPLVTGDPAAASLVPGRCPPAAQADRGDPSERTEATADLGPCRPGPTPADPPRGGANVRIAQGKGNPQGNRREPEPGNGRRDRRTTPDEGQPSEGGRRGRTSAGKRETGGKPAREPGGRTVRPQTTRAKARGFGAARISGAAANPGQVCANRAEQSASVLTDKGRRSGHEPQTLDSLRWQTAADPAVMAARVSAMYGWCRSGRPLTAREMVVLHVRPRYAGPSVAGGGGTCAPGGKPADRARLRHR
jgi:hypothetical protein